ncbi:ArsC family reductase [Alteromonas sp. 5E99-2]|uniref:ArsC family reductase n=1 Tax=Alteromonas sp. 5E99-2 TaxID=2817683 RepID=UPI001A9969CA|nr:ArsC family reductase [Alteromonas sp. 5E99-2]MBO1254882.1 ArsC family reductase [Alteromonas sp. 5E99-2]
MTTLYGISNCDTIRKAKKWLDANNTAFTFHDYRKDGIDSTWLTHVEKELGWEVLLNKRGTTFRQLPDEAKNNLNASKAIQLMLDNPAMIKRPILCHNEQYLCGFAISAYEEVLNS